MNRLKKVFINQSIKQTNLIVYHFSYIKVTQSASHNADKNNIISAFVTEWKVDLDATRRLLPTNEANVSLL